jgi:hypothetical protein
MADRTPAVAAGQRTTVAGIVSTRLKVDMAKPIFDYENMGAPLYTTLAMLSKEDAIAKTVAWHTDELVPKFARINGGISNGLTDTTFTVDTPMGSYVNSGWLIQFTRTGETCLTTTGGSATSIVVTARSWGNTAAGTVVDNDEILIIGPAYAEGATLGSAITTTEVQYTNTLQTLRHNWSIGGLLAEISKRGGTYNGDEVKRQREKMVATHKRSLELALLFGEAATSGGTSTTYGLIPWLVRYASGNVNSASTVTESVFEAGNATWFRGGESDERVLMMSRTVHGIANQFAASLQRTKSGQKMYGLRITDYTSAHGDISLLRNVHLEGDEYAKYAVGFDPKKVGLKMGRDTRILKDRQGTSVDGQEEEIITDLAGIWGSPETCYLWTDWAA